MTTIIHVPHEYRGWNTNERTIPAGEYVLGEAALYGVGQYLLDNDMAEVLSATLAPEVVPDPASPPPAESAPEPVPVAIVDNDDDTEELDGEPILLLNMTVNELEEYADGIGLDPTTVKGTGTNGNILKADLVKAISLHEAGLRG